MPGQRGPSSEHTLMAQNAAGPTVREALTMLREITGPYRWP